MKKEIRTWPRCLATGKFEYTRKEARREARWHAKQPCGSCLTGWYLWEEYPCDSGKYVHFHIGHLSLHARQMA